MHYRYRYRYIRYFLYLSSIISFNLKNQLELSEEILQVCPQLQLTYCLPVVAEQHQACLGDHAGSAGSGNLQGLTFSCGTAIHQTGAVESHFLQKERHKTAFWQRQPLVNLNSCYCHCKVLCVLLASDFTGSLGTSVLSIRANHFYTSSGNQFISTSSK